MSGELTSKSPYLELKNMSEKELMAWADSLTNLTEKTPSDTSKPEGPMDKEDAKSATTFYSDYETSSIVGGMLIHESFKCGETLFKHTKGTIKFTLSVELCTEISTGYSSRTSCAKEVKLRIETYNSTDRSLKTTLHYLKFNSQAPKADYAPTIIATVSDLLLKVTDCYNERIKVKGLEEADKITGVVLQLLSFLQLSKSHQKNVKSILIPYKIESITFEGWSRNIQDQIRRQIDTLKRRYPTAAIAMDKQKKKQRTRGPSAS